MLELFGVDQNLINSEFRESLKALAIQNMGLLMVLIDNDILKIEDWSKTQAKATSIVDQVWTAREKEYVEKFIKEQRSTPEGKLLFDMLLRKGMEEQGYKIEDEEDGDSKDGTSGPTEGPSTDSVED